MVVMRLPISLAMPCHVAAVPLMLLANIEFRVPYSQRYLVRLVLGLVGSVGLGLPLLLWLGLVGLELW